MSSSVATINRLAGEKSAYLLQHATNPVDWYPWGNEAFQKARHEDKPIFLSIGYSTCHWCHVMEHESFESPVIAALLNEHYVAIKIDREERPDIDKQYMTFVQAMTGGGGWPASIWLTPDLRAVMAGTYFPPDDNYFGRPGFKTVLTKFAEQWRSNRNKLEQQSKYLCETLGGATLEVLQGNAMPPVDSDKRLAIAFQRRYDPEYGGFSKAPKFPQPGIFMFLSRYYVSTKLVGDVNKDSIESIIMTLKMMARGGIYDHVGMGFHRYSTDAFWHVPHFEKMLYDQAQLAVAYSEAFMLSKEETFARVITGIITYMIRDLGHPDGGFYSAEDADSYAKETNSAENKKKVEGAFYVWTYEEVCHILNGLKTSGSPGTKVTDLVCKVFDIRPLGNVEPNQDPHGELKAKNVLIQRKPLIECAKDLDISEDQLVEEIGSACELLFNARKERPRPHRDEKFVTAWNGLAMSGLVYAGMALHRDDWIDAAVKTATFIRSNLVNTSSCHLLRTCYAEATKDNSNKIEQLPEPISAVCNDYCCVIAGLLDLYEATLDITWLTWAAELQEVQNSLFWDSTENMRSFFTSNNPQLLFKLKDEQDGAEPGCNSLSCLNLLRLSDYFKREDWRKMAEDIFCTYSELIAQMPIAVPQLMAAFMRWKTGARHYIIFGSKGDKHNDLLPCITCHFDPFKTIRHIEEPFFDNKLPRNDDLLQKKSEGFKGIVICESNGMKELKTKEDVNNFMKVFRL